jgi:hypothetical protein
MLEIFKVPFSFIEDTFSVILLKPFKYPGREYLRDHLNKSPMFCGRKNKRYLKDVSSMF